MITLITATGREIMCDAIVEATLYPVLHIHTHELTGAEAWTLFSNPAETVILRKIENEKETVYRDYTYLQSVQQSPFIAGDLLIWLNHQSNEEG